MGCIEIGTTMPYVTAITSWGGFYISITYGGIQLTTFSRNARFYIAPGRSVSYDRSLLIDQIR